MAPKYQVNVKVPAFKYILLFTNFFNCEIRLIGQSPVNYKNLVIDQMRYWNPLKKFSKEFEEKNILRVLLKELFLKSVSNIDQGRFMVAPVNEHPLRIS